MSLKALLTEKVLVHAIRRGNRNVEKTILRKPKKRQDIQGIRGWAISSVVAFHFFPDYCPNGYLGVDMFFVVSGFLMAMIITRSVGRGAAFFRTFYYRRIKRILPLYYLTCLVVLMFVVLKLPTFRSLNFASSRRAVSFTANLRISKDDPIKNYEKMVVLSDAMDLFTHTWSLCVEMQWYLLVPLLFYLQSLLLSRKTSFYFGVALASMVFYFSVDKNTAFYNVFARMWQFCAGIMAFMWQHDNNEVNTKSEQAANNEEQQRSREYCTISRLVPYLSWAAFILAVPVLFFWIKLAKDIARLEVTVMTAALILAGKRHQIAALTKPEMVFVGEISYALYLIHWPVFIVMKYFYPQNPLSPFVGVTISVFLAVLTYQYYEKNYLQWPPFAIITLLTFLLIGCILLSLLPSELEIMKPVKIDYDHVKAEDAAWNMTLMRQLNVAESPRGTHMWHKECKYSKRFLERKINPLGFCTIKDGSGTLDMLVAGNSYACNQGDLVYNAFKPYARHFNIFCVPDCEMFLPHCKIIKFNFTQIVEQLKPAVVFLVERSFSLKVPLNVAQPVENDKTFRLYLKTLEFLEKVTKKIYILQAFPRCVDSCSTIALQYLKNGKALRTIKNGLVIGDAFFARHRIRELNKRCKKCELVDYMPVLVDKKGQYLAYNPDTNLMYLDHEQHFNRFGRQRLQIVFDNLAKDFGATWKSSETPLSASTLPVN